jgi:hypothetical protein
MRLASALVALWIAAVLGVSPRAQSIGQTLLTTQQPTVSGATGSFELGVRLTLATSGHVLAIRYWKLAGESGPHVGHVWSSTGTALAMVTFANETDAGWQEQALPAPLAVTSAAALFVSVNSSAAAHFPVSAAALQFGLSNGDITATSGAYSTSAGAFPVSSSPHNYFRDVRWVPDPPAVVLLGPDPASPGDFLARLLGFAPGAYTVTVTMTPTTGPAPAVSSSIPLVMPTKVGP